MFVRLFKKYVSLCPSSAKAFYVQPLSKPSLTCWYSSNPLGHYTISKRLCDSVGIEGFITNHSLRTTAATRLYESGVNEQLIMERTGYRSLEGVRSYKRTTAQQKQSISDILNQATSLVATTDSATKTSPENCSDSVRMANDKEIEMAEKSVSIDSELTSSHEQLIPSVQTFNSSQSNPTTVMNTNIQNRTKDKRPGTFILNSCSSVTFNIHYHQ